MSLSKKQHEGFASFFEKPTRESLRSLLKENIGETDYLDFKEIWVPFPKLSKHILALSNSGGGAIIIGVKENDDGTTTPVGLKEFQDKEKISKGVAKYLPDNIVYVRCGTSTTEAKQNDLQKIINERIETGYSSTHVMALSEHLQQLKELYKAKESKSPFSNMAKIMAIFEDNKFEDYHSFISNLINRKKEKIEAELGL